MSKRKTTYPGSIYVRNNILYIRFKGRRISTGLSNTRQGNRIAKTMLEKLWFEHSNLTQEIIKPINIEEAFKEFLATKVSRMPKTITQYKLAFKAIITDKTKRLDNSYIEKDIQNYLKNTTHVPITINNYLTHLQIFLNYCSEQSWINRKNFKKIYKKREPDTKVEPYTEKEINLLLPKLRQIHPELAVMVEFMLETGARIVDCLTLTQEQIKPNSIIWKNKITKRDEERPVSDRAIRLLGMLPHRPDRIFRWRYSSASRLNRFLKTAMDAAGIARNGRAFQEFRSTFRMNLIKKQVPEIYIEYLLRHSKPDITAFHYTQYKNEELIKHLNK